MLKIVCTQCAPGFSGPIDPRDLEMGFKKRVIRLVVKKPADHAISINGVKQEQLRSIFCDQCGVVIPDGTVGVAVSMWRAGSLGDWEREYGTPPREGSMSDRPTCGACQKTMTPENSTVVPEMFLCDDCAKLHGYYAQTATQVGAVQSEARLKLIKAADPFMRVLAIIDALPEDSRPSDEDPLRSVLPGVWPSLGELRNFVKACQR